PKQGLKQLADNTVCTLTISQDVTKEGPWWLWPIDEERGGMNAKFDEEWTLRALCAQRSPDALFVRGAAQQQARASCFACPVRLECLVDALDNRIQYGVWGGMTERERRALLRRAPSVESWRSTLEDVDPNELTTVIGQRWPAPRPRRRATAAEGA